MSLKPPTIKEAMEIIEIIHKKYKVPITLAYNRKQWSVMAMGKRFYSADPTKAIQMAVTFIYNAHESKKEE